MNGEARLVAFGTRKSIIKEKIAIKSMFYRKDVLTNE